MGKECSIKPDFTKMHANRRALGWGAHAARVLRSAARRTARVMWDEELMVFSREPRVDVTGGFRRAAENSTRAACAPRNSCAQRQKDR
jgi:hypothetical protein